MLPLFLILLACAAAVAMALGTNPDLARYHHGLQFILITRRVEGPLIAFSIICCLFLLGLVVANKRRAWWLIALAPITALFAYRFSLDSDNFFSIAENPQMVSLSTDQITFVRDEDWVVGIVFEEQPYALPYESLYSTPAVVINDREKRALVLWSPFANVAKAFSVDREIKPREMDIVSMPANALLIYNTRNGQFINGLTGRTPNGSLPDGFKSEISATKTKWKDWRAAHPDSKVMPPTGKLAHNPPCARVMPVYPLPPQKWETPPQTRIVFIPTTQPAAIASDSITNKPINLMSGKTPLLIFRDPSTGQVKVFERRLDEDLMPRFDLNHNRRRPLATFIDADTNTGWNTDGVAVDGDKQRKGKKLRAIDFDEDVYWGVMKFWNPGVQMTKGQ